MSVSVSAIPFLSELQAFPVELFHVISDHLPLAYRPSALLSLALTCHRLHEIVIPHLLYKDVRLVDRDQVLPTLNTLIATLELVNEEDIQKPSHCIHRLCIDASIETPIRTPDHFMNTLQKLVDVGGLCHLSVLTLHVDCEWDGTDGDNDIDIHFILPWSFLQSLKTKCPHLKSFHLTGSAHQFANNWINSPGLFSIESLTSIRIQGNLYEYPSPTINFSQLPLNLHTLELQLYDNPRGKPIDASGPEGLFNCVFPNLNTLILDHFTTSDPASANLFWRLHPGIKRLEFGDDMTGGWFDNFQVGMLPNLAYLQCNVQHALVLVRQASKTLIRLSLLNTYNAQAPYLLRVVAPEGVLPALRSLSIQRDSGNSPKPREGHRWREDENGKMSHADAKKPSRQFDGNYIMSISKAAPNLEELELMGTSNDTIDSITASLSLCPKLQRLTFSGTRNGANKPFFARSYNWTDGVNLDVGRLAEKDYGKYAPESFNEAARDLADGCRTLDVVTMGVMVGDLVIRYGLSARIVRESEGGAVKEVERIRPWGNLIGREEEW